MADLIIPSWLDQVKGVTFDGEKEVLGQLERWALDAGWEVTDGSSLPLEMRQRTDVLIKDPKSDNWFRVGVLRKSASRRGTVRIDASNFRLIELVFHPRTKKWRVEAGAVPIEDDILKAGWPWLVRLLFRE